MNQRVAAAASVKRARAQHGAWALGARAQHAHTSERSLACASEGLKYGRAVDRRVDESDDDDDDNEAHNKRRVSECRCGHTRANC